MPLKDTLNLVFQVEKNVSDCNFDLILKNEKFFINLKSRNKIKILFLSLNQINLMYTIILVA